MTRRLVIDIETASLVDLSSAGVDAYAEDVTTRVLCLAYQFDDAPIVLWRPGDTLIVIPHIDKNTICVAHNAGFEIAIWKHVLEPLGWPPVPPLWQWSCTMARAQYHGLPAALDDVAGALRFPDDQRKDAAGRRIMLQLTKPRSLEPLRWWHEDEPKKLDALARYCVRDVEIEAKLDRMLPELPPGEAELWRINQEMNTRGVRLDLDLIDRLAGIVTTETRRLNRELGTLTGNILTSVNQVGRIRKFLADNHGVKLDVLDRDTVSRVLALDPFLDDESERILQIRAEAAKTSTAKLTSMKHSVSGDGQARGLFRYYGASRTGRYSSQRIQLQNLARPSIKDPNAAIDLIKHHDADAGAVSLLFNDTPLGVVSSCLRGCIVAALGRLLAIADLAQIEARVIAWLAGQHDILRVFAAGEDVYTWTANRVGSSERQLGKVMVLALGFGMGAGRFCETALKYGIAIPPDRAQRLVDDWRDANDQIVNFWWELGNAAMRTVDSVHGTYATIGRITLERRRKAMVMRLPSGRELFYQYIGSEWVEQRRQFTYEGVNQYTRRWERLRAWSGRFAENATQAVARDVLTDALRKLHAAGLHVIGTVHDELIAECPAAEADAWLDRMLATMRQAPAWARGLPVWAEGKVAERYGK